MPSNSTTVIGAGISGLACARALTEAGVPVRVLDRGNRAGGRMASRTLHGRQVDLGASYLTASSGSPFAAVAKATGRPVPEPNPSAPGGVTSSPWASYRSV